MLSEEEKREMIEDGLSVERRENFRCLTEGRLSGSRSIDEYLEFLQSLQKIFGPFEISREKMVTLFNKL